MEARRILCLLMLLAGVAACHHSPVQLLLPAGSSTVKLEVDSLAVPELAHFPIRLKLTNHTRHKVVLVFDSFANGNRYQVHNLYQVAGQDTFYLGVRTSKRYLVFSENTVTSFQVDGYFLRGEGHFHSLKQVDSVCKDGKLVYIAKPSVSSDIALSETALPSDTLLFPTKLEASTAQTFVVYSFLPASYKWREERLH